MKDHLKKVHKNKPLVSIITTVYNGEKYIENTILSILNQTYSNIEYIIIDGGSTDGTLSIIEKYKENIDFFISEEDRGMYDGINKGMRCATGEIYAYLNADDLYEVDAIQIVVDKFQKSNCSLVFGHCTYIDENGKELYKNRAVQLPSYLVRWLGRIPFSQQTAFWKKEVYIKIGGFDTDLKYVADSKFFFKILLDKTISYCNTGEYLAKFRWHSEGFSSAHLASMSKEGILMRGEINVVRCTNMQNCLKKSLAEFLVKMHNADNIFKKNMYKIIFRTTPMFLFSFALMFQTGILR